MAAVKLFSGENRIKADRPYKNPQEAQEVLTGFGGFAPAFRSSCGRTPPALLTPIDLPNKQPTAPQAVGSAGDPMPRQADKNPQTITISGDRYGGTCLAEGIAVNRHAQCIAGRTRRAWRTAVFQEGLQGVW